jgi:hypothetical protein
VSDEHAYNSSLNSVCSSMEKNEDDYMEDFLSLFEDLEGAYAEDAEYICHYFGMLSCACSKMSEYPESESQFYKDKVDQSGKFLTLDKMNMIHDII